MKNVDVLMPKLGESITEGTIVKWWKQPGDFVKKDETLLEISTDKVDSEIPSPFAGKLVEIKARENDTIEVDSIIAVIATGVDADAENDGSPESTPETLAKQPADSPTVTPEDDVDNGQSLGSGGGQVYDIEMPKLGESITEGNIVKWWKQPGDFVKKDETLLEISTDKVDSEIPSPYEGTLTELMAREGDTISVGSIIARISSAATTAGASQSTAPASEKSVAVADDGATNGSTLEAEQPYKPVPADGDRISREHGGRFFSPLVRSIARKEGITLEELEGVPGTGVEGRVTKRDILSYIESGRFIPQSAGGGEKAPGQSAPAGIIPPQPSTAASAARPSPSLEDLQEKFSGKRVEVLPMDNIRKKIADHMVMSKHTSPHVYGVAEVDFTRVMGIVKKYRETWQKKEGMKLTINPFILYSVTRAMNDFPDVNASVDGQNVIKYRYANLGMAVATERGLLVPVLKNADEMNFRGIARNAYDLAIRTRDRKLKPDEVVGATFTVTNYGVFGNVIGFPIINQPNVAILGVGAVKKRPVVIETEFGDHIAIRQIGFLTLSYDHRIVDGELGDKFLQRIRHHLENFQEEWL